MTMIENVARAIFCLDGHPPHWDESAQDVEWKEGWRAIAKAAIEAMREPTDEMTHVGAKMLILDAMDYSISERVEAASIYTAMIDAALKE